MLGKCDGFRNIHNEVMREGQCRRMAEGDASECEEMLAQVEPVSRFTQT
jgi:hypothetical protein